MAKLCLLCSPVGWFGTAEFDSGARHELIERLAHGAGPAGLSPSRLQRLQVEVGKPWLQGPKNRLLRNFQSEEEN